MLHLPLSPFPSTLVTVDGLVIESLLSHNDRRLHSTFIINFCKLIFITYHLLLTVGEVWNPYAKPVAVPVPGNPKPGGGFPYLGAPEPTIRSRKIVSPGADKSQHIERVLENSLRCASVPQVRYARERVRSHP